MSLGYAQKLSYREDVGAVGMSEVFDPTDVLHRKIEQLAMTIQKSKHLVAFTGAGISTSCGIPDFRGPKGVWTLQVLIQSYVGQARQEICMCARKLDKKAGKGVPDASVPFHCAAPSLTHMALVELERAGILKFVISQNVDSLHLRSGIPREKLAELHGNSFRELCPSCGAEYLRDFEVETIGMKLTSRQCSNVDCQAKLRDTVLDWEDALPKKEMSLAERHCRMADVVLCLGTSLQITPACNLPLKSLSGGGRIVIVNLQPTPKDKKASLVVNGFVDKDVGHIVRLRNVIEGVMHLLNLRIPPYVRIDFVQIVLIHAKRRKTYAKWTLRLLSVHGSRAPLPFVKSVEVTFPERTDMKAAFLSKQPFVLKRETARKKPFMMALKINFNHGCGCASTTILWDVDFQVKQNSFIQDKNEILQKLRTKAEQESQCGQLETIERQVLPRFKSTTHAIATNIVRYHLPDAKSAEGDDAICTSNGPTTKRLDDGDNSDELPPKRTKLVRSDV